MSHNKLKNEKIFFMCSVANNYKAEERHDNKGRVLANFVMESGGIRGLTSSFE